ncbi:MAG TPA: LysR substrate-binding domain-containing protein [Microbacteriaceae bacterium]|nr:LysR substrate-binding domain-containing protein [Microbacteriaceae bacterium]
MNLRDLSYLVAVAEEGHFGRAAATCFVSQPTLSTQIRKLERELGVILVERARGGALLTTAGRRIVGRARAALEATAEIKEIARLERDPDSTVVRLGILPTSGPYVMPHVLRLIRRRLPRLRLHLVEDKTEPLLDQLRTGGLDAVVCALPVEATDLHTEPLFDEPFVLATPGGHPLAGKPDLVVSDLGDERLLLLEEGHCLRAQALEVCRLAGAREKEQFRATSLETLREMVAVNVGITLLPVLSVQPPVAPAENVLLTRFTGDVPVRHMAMLWRSSAVIGGLLSALAAAFRSAPGPLLDPRTIPHPAGHDSSWPRQTLAA